jgi:hypothetical protein
MRKEETVVNMEVRCNPTKQERKIVAGTAKCEAIFLKRKTKIQI